eukprot:g47845.t1
MKQAVDKKSKICMFAHGDKVLVLPVVRDPFKVRCIGLYQIEKLSQVDYPVKMPHRKKNYWVCHVNVLKPYYDEERDLEKQPLVDRSHGIFGRALQENTEGKVGHKFGNIPILKDGSDILQTQHQTWMDDTKECEDEGCGGISKNILQEGGVAIFGTEQTLQEPFNKRCHVVAPLMGLLKKNMKFQLAEQCQEAFENLKAVLTTAPVLAMPNFLKHFKAAINTSDEE